MGNGAVSPWYRLTRKWIAWFLELIFVLTVQRGKIICYVLKTFELTLTWNEFYVRVYSWFYVGSFCLDKQAVETQSRVTITFLFRQTGCWDSVKGNHNRSIGVKITVLKGEKFRDFENRPLSTFRRCLQSCCAFSGSTMSQGFVQGDPYQIDLFLLIWTKVLLPSREKRQSWKLWNAFFQKKKSKQWQVFYQI